MDFCKTAFKNGQIRLLSDGLPQRDFIHIDDICRAVSLVAGCASKELKYNAYNLGSGVTHTIGELAHSVSEIWKDRYEKELPVILQDGEISNNASKFSYISRFKYCTDRISELGFKPTTSMGQGISEILDYLERYF